MKTRYTFTFLVSILSFQLAIAQSTISSIKNVKVKWGNEEKDKMFHRSALDQIIGQDEGGYYILKDKYSSVMGFRFTDPTLTYFDKNLNLVKSADVDPQNGQEKTDLWSFIELGDKLYMLSTYDNYKADKISLYCHDINKSTLEVSADPKKIAEVKYKGKNNERDFSYKLSPDSSTILVSYNLPYDKKDDKEGLGFIVYDSDFKELWKKEVKLPYEDKLFSVEDYKVDNDGNVYVLGLLYQEKGKMRRSGKPNYEYRLLTYRQEGEVANYVFNLNDKFITDMGIAIAEDGNVTATGFYSEKGNYSIKGIFHTTVNNEDQVIESRNVQEFDKKFLENFMSEKKAEKGVELSNYKFDHILSNADGSTTLTAEQYYVTISTYYDSKGYPHTHYHYHYNDVMVINLTSEGKINWASKVPKTQVSTDDGGYYLSYSLIPTNNKLYFVFNDYTKLMEDEMKGNKNAIHFGLGASVIAVAEVDEHGKVAKRVLIENKDTDVKIRPKVSKNVGENEMLVISLKRKKSRLGKFIFSAGKTSGASVN